MPRNLKLNFGKYEFKNELGASWVKIFYQHVKQIEDAFDEVDDALYVIDTNKYSILSEAYQWKHEGPYEFLLQYPELTGYNYWSQTNFPLGENCDTSKKNVDGFYNISCTWTGQHWGGLCRSTGCSLLEGTVNHTNWFYAIGTKKDCGDYGVSDIPGPNSYRVHEVYLWMRVSDIILSNFFTSCSRLMLRIHFFTFIFLLNK